MRDLLTIPLARVVVLGVVLGLVILITTGPPTTEEELRRVVVTSTDVERLRRELVQQSAREPTPEELRRKLQDHLWMELLYREALVRRYDRDGPSNRAALVRRMELVMESRRSGDRPTNAEVEAYLALRRGQYQQEREAPAGAALRRLALKDMDAEARVAAREQLLHELAEGYRIVLAPAARGLLQFRRP